MISIGLSNKGCIVKKSKRGTPILSNDFKDSTSIISPIAFSVITTVEIAVAPSYSYCTFSSPPHDKKHVAMQIVAIIRSLILLNRFNASLQHEKNSITGT